MVDFNGGGGVSSIPNPFAAPIGPALSADQINSSMGLGPGGVGAQDQNVLNNNFNSFGKQTDYYSNLGASYGRNTGYYGDTSGLSPGDAPKPGQSVFDTGTTAYNSYGNPALGFNGAAYLQQNPDVQASGMDPWAHFAQFGQKEGRAEPLFQGFTNTGQGSQQQPAFDWSNYFSNAAAPAAGDKGSGWEAEYLLANPDVMAAAKQAGGDVNAYADQHWMNFGQNEGRGIFDPTTYLQQNPDVAASGMNPFEHYLNYGQNEGRAAPTDMFNAASYYAANPDVFASGMDAADHWAQYGSKEGRDGGYDIGARSRGPAQLPPSPGTAGDNNILATQRSPYADMIRDDPNTSLKLAARLYSEDQNNPETRTAILEAMLNRMYATGQNPLNAAYYPKDQTAYNNAMNTLSSNNDLLGQIQQEMERAFGGSNLSNYATDWASADVAANSRATSTPTWTSPSSEEFFRKDINNPKTGAGIASQNQKWFQSVTGPPL